MLWMALARHFGWLWLIGLTGISLSGIALAQTPIRPAQAGMRFVRNYTVEEYKAADQNWSIVQDPRGVMFFGNSQGVLEYDGVTWRLTALANRSTVRSLAVDARGRVYVGGVNDFGYLAPDDKGQQQFVSLVEKLPEDARHFADIWRTYATAEGAVFQAVNFLFFWNGQTIEFLRPASSGDTFSACLEVNREIFVLQRSRGLFKLVNHTLQPIPGGEWLAEKRLSGLLPMPDGKWLAVIRGEGLFVYDGKAFTPFAVELSKELITWDPYKAMVLPDGRFAFATLRHGAVVLRPDGTLDEVIDKAAGLQNQQVKHVFADRDGNLWMGLDNGLARAEIISPFTLFDERLGIEDVVQAFIEHAGRYYVATASGTYVWDPQVNRSPGAPLFQYIPGPATNCFNFGIAGNDLFVAADTGVYRLDGTTATRILDSKLREVCFCFCASTRYPNRLYVGQQYGISILERQGSTWVNVGKIPDFNTEVRYIIELPNGALWLGTQAEGVMKVEMEPLPPLSPFNPETTRVQIRRFTTKDGLPLMSRIRLTAVPGRLLFLTAEGTLEFDETTGWFYPSTLLVDTKAKPLRRLVSDTRGVLWGYFEDHSCTRLKPVGGGKYRADETLLKRLPATFYNVTVADSHGDIWFGGIQGLIRIDPQQIKEQSESAPVLIRKVLAGSKRDLIFGGAGKTSTMPPIELPYTANQLRIEYALPTFIQEQATRYQYFLEGVDTDWSEWSTETVKEYNNLREGHYQLRIRAEDAPGYLSQETVLGFRVFPPWYRTWWAYAGYIVFLGGIGFGSLKWRVRTLETQKKALERLVVERTKTVTQQKDEISRQNAELDAINHQLADNIEQLRKAHLDTERKNRELESKNQELLASQQRADRIFSALAQALPGTILDGKYRLDSQIGAGGFGVVFRGTHLGLDRPIAIKVFKPIHGNDSADAVERFRREGVSASRLNHPNAVQMLDFGISEQGIAYLVMELLQGHSLYHELKLYRVLPPTRTADILVPVCSALAEAHRLGIIHRDIKPENIFLNKTPEGEVVKVVDFGVAKLAQTESGDQLKQLTETGMVVGTPVYVAPERLNSDAYDGKSDVYSVGIMLFQMLTGTLPFNVSGNNPMQVFLATLHKTPPELHTINPTVQPEISAVVLSALEKSPHQRPGAWELACAFVEAVNQSGISDSSEWIPPSLTQETERPRFETDPGWNVQTLGDHPIDNEPTQIAEPPGRTQE